MLAIKLKHKLFWSLLLLLDRVVISKEMLEGS